MNLIIEAARYAEIAHRGVTRKYNGEPFINHPMRVANGVMFTAVGIYEDVVAAAWLHDVVEDTPFPITSFPEGVQEMVEQVTNPVKEVNQPRDIRKHIDREHLKKACLSARVIKYLDRIDNIQGLADCYHVKYIKMYLSETGQLMDVLYRDIQIIQDLHNRLYDECLQLAKLRSIPHWQYNFGQRIFTN